MKHGHGYESPAYRSWKGMRQRCNNSNHPRFADYGGRGIQVCERWNDFVAFLEDMGQPPADERHALDRIDNDANYTPNNCRWASYREQANNSRKNVRLTAFGRTLTVAQWEREAGIRGLTIQKRIARGWTIEDAISQPRGTRLKVANRTASGQFDKGSKWASSAP